MTGREIKDLFDADWDALLGVEGAYLDNGGIFDSDGREFSADDVLDAKTYRVAGTICSDNGNRVREVCSLVSLVKKWRNAREFVSLVITLRKDARDLLVSLAKQHGWAVR